MLFNFNALQTKCYIIMYQFLLSFQIFTQVLLYYTTGNIT